MNHSGDPDKILIPLRTDTFNFVLQEYSKIVYFNDADDCNEFEIISMN